MTREERQAKDRELNDNYRRASDLQRRAEDMESEAADHIRAAMALEEEIARAAEAGDFR